MYNLALTTKNGELFGEPGIFPLGRVGTDNLPIKDDEFIPLPPGATVSILPERIALGRDKKKRTVELEQIEKTRVFPAAAVIPPGYTRTYLPAYKKGKNAPVLPFFAYTAMAIQGEAAYCAAVKTHDDIRWLSTQYNSRDLPGKIKRKLKAFPKNRLLKHLSNCSLEYGCFTAQNIFYDRWEGGIPVSAVCNARCAGCISENRLDTVPSPQERIKFVPTVEEIVEIAVPHLQVEGGIVSFGQGCEGEPLMKGELILEAVKEIRRQTDQGTININTNASRPDILEKLFEAGMDSVRVSMNSAIEERYNKYFNPKGYGFSDVKDSIRRANERGAFVSLNYLFLPGVNDREEERDAFFKLLGEFKIGLIQVRNLNIDPDYYFEIMPRPKGKALGVRNYLAQIKSDFPGVKIGSFSIPLR